MEVVKPEPRPKELPSITGRFETPCGKRLYITVTYNGRPLEVFIHIERPGDCLRAWGEALGRVISIALRSGVDPEAIINTLKFIRCPSPEIRPNGNTSCPDAIAKFLEEVMEGSPWNSSETKVR